MSNSDWNIIFKLKEFRDYLSNNELIQLSICSKKLRMLLTKAIFKTLNLRSFIRGRDYFSLLIREEVIVNYISRNLCINPYKPLARELIESKKEFSNDLKLLKGSPKKLVVIECGWQHYLLNEIPIIFPNITTLVFNESEFTLDTFQYLLDKFKCLENLELIENIIFHDTEISYDYTITYPTSLKSLKIRGTGIMMVRDKINSISINHCRYSNGLHMFNLTYQQLPNLVNFSYGGECFYYDEKRGLFEFIRINPQLKRLNLTFYDFSLELFDTIKNCENLTYLEYICEYDHEDYNGYEYPILCSVNYLHISSEYTYSYLGEMIPNLITLEIEFDSINNLQSFYDVIGSFTRLKSLKLIFFDYSIILDLTLPKLNYLEKLEISLNYEFGKLLNIEWDVSTCDRLKSVSFTKNEIYCPFEEFELTEELAKQWDLYYFPHKLAYLKNINK